VNLTPYDIDTERGTLMMWLGKGRKARLVLLGARLRLDGPLRGRGAAAAMRLVGSGDAVPNGLRRAVRKNRLSDMVKRYTRPAGFVQVRQVDRDRHARCPSVTPLANECGQVIGRDVSHANVTVVPLPRP
jgi:hypothetical protein